MIKLLTIILYVFIFLGWLVSFAVCGAAGAFFYFVFFWGLFLLINNFLN